MTHLLSSLWIPLDSAPVWTCGSLHGAQGGERDGVRDKIIGFPQTSLHEHESRHGQICIWLRQSEHVLEPQTSNICLHIPDPLHMHLDPRPSTFTPAPSEPQYNAPQTPTHASIPLDFQHIHLYPRSQHMQLHRTFRPPQHFLLHPQTFNTCTHTFRPPTRHLHLKPFRLLTLSGSQTPTHALSSRDHNYILQLCPRPEPLTPQPAQFSPRLLIIQPKLDFHRIPERPVWIFF